MLRSVNERPSAKQHPAHPQPGRLNTRERLRVSARIQALEGDWLFQMASPEGKRRLLAEHNLLLR